MAGRGSLCIHPDGSLCFSSAVFYYGDRCCSVYLYAAGSDQRIWYYLSGLPEAVSDSGDERGVADKFRMSELWTSYMDREEISVAYPRFLTHNSSM